MFYAAMTHTGMVREINEDSYYADGSLFIVADGMGGHQAGEVASSLAIEVFLRDFSPAGADADGILGAMREAVLKANAAIREQSLSDPSREGMGTTFTAALLRGDGLFVAHVGDSRAYLFTDGSFRQITQDHSLVAEMVRSGSLLPDEARNHPRRNIITRALGIDDAVQVDLARLDPPREGFLLICTDGLTGELSDEDIQALLREGREAGGGVSALAESLVEAALQSGGNDNVTVILADLESGWGEGAAEGAAGTSAPTAIPRRDGGAGPRAARRRIALLVLLALSFLVLLAVFLFFPYVKNRSYFVGVDDSGNIALYRGFSWKLLGMDLKEVYRSSLAPAENLPEEKQERLLHPVTKDLEGAERDFTALVREAESGVRVPDFLGMTWEEASALAERKELLLRCRGEAEPRPEQRVAWQQPAAGELLYKLDTVFVELQEDGPGGQSGPGVPPAGTTPDGSGD